MKEQRIISFIGMNSCLIMVLLFESNIGKVLNLILALIYLVKYCYFQYKK